MKKYLLTFILTALITVVIGQNLITNPSAESDPSSNGWTEASGSWSSGSEVAAHDGSYHFYAGSSISTAELYQDVDVSSFATSIDNGTQDFYFQGYMRDYNGTDEAEMIVEYRDASSNVLDTYDTGLHADADWTKYSDTRTAPVGTRIIRIRLLSKNNSFMSLGDSDGYTDDLLLNAGSTPLPIELISFNFSVEGKDIELTWETASEVNNDYFTVERSQDAVNFEPVGRVDGKGNYNGLSKYTLTDFNPLTGVSYYRLKQTDFDGKYSYSDIISVNYVTSTPFDGPSMKLFPNPTTRGSDVKMELSGLSPNKEILVVVTNVLGQQMYSKVIVSDTNGNILYAVDPYNQLPSGTYVVVATSDDKLLTKRLVIQ